MQRNAVLLGAGIALLVLGACRGVRIRKCSEGCPSPLICHVPTQQCWLPPDAGGGPDNLEGSDGGAGDAGAQSDDGGVTPVDTDGGPTRDGGVADAGGPPSVPDGGATPDGGCADNDGDGHASASCGGNDCDDNNANRHPGHAEVCDGIDNDCNNVVDDGVCVPCPSGYSGTDGKCTDINECASATSPCGTVATACTNTPGSYQCICKAGYAAPASGGLCTDVNECAAGESPCGAASTGCTNTPGSYACACLGGFSAPVTGGTCADIDECAKATDTCDHDPQACSNTIGSFTCGCPSGFSGSGVGATGCLLTDPSLLSLVPSGGTLSPAFSPSTTTYTLVLPPGVASVALTPTVRYPSHATITVATAAVGSGSASATINVGLAPQPVTATVSTEGGPSRTYTVVTQRGSTYFKASNTDSYDRFGVRVALSGDGLTLAVSATGESSKATGVNGNQTDNLTNDAGAVYVFIRSGLIWTQQAYIKASNTELGDSFGSGLALSGDGSILAVGAYMEDSSGSSAGQSDNSAANSGAVYVFNRAGSTWSQSAYLKPYSTTAYSASGVALAISGDGLTLAVGARGESSDTTGINGPTNTNAAGSGAVYIYTRWATSWSQQAFIKASNAETGDSFGGSVALSFSGSTLVVGAEGEASNAVGIDGNQGNNNADNSGAAYVFTRSGSTWTQEAYIKASNAEADDRFGTSVAVSGDGLTIAVGAPQEDSEATGINGTSSNGAVESGAVYVFVRGAAWTQQAFAKASNTRTWGQFGTSVALSQDGSTLAVGAVGESSNARGINGDQTDNSAAGSGAVYLLGRAAGQWAQLSYVKASNTETGNSEQFGVSVALSSGASTLAVGAYFENSSATGVNGNQSDHGVHEAGAVYGY